MASIESFLPEVLMDAPGCPEPVALNALRHSLEEFCRESLYWAADADPIDVEAGKHTYDLDSPESDTVVAGIIWIAHKGNKLAPASEDLLDLQWPKLQSLYPMMNVAASTPWREAASDVAQVYYQPTPRTVRLVGIPAADAPGGITMKVGVVPLPDAGEVSDTLFQDYREAIANGAKYRLLMQPNKEWTDRKAAPDYKVLFDIMIREAKAKRLRGHTRDDQTVIRTTSYWR